MSQQVHRCRQRRVAFGGRGFKEIRGPVRLLGFLVVLQLTALSPVQGQVRTSDIEVGVNFGINLTDGGINNERIGVQGLVPVLGPVELAASFGYFHNFPESSKPPHDFTGSAWRMFFTARVRPLGRGSFLSLGYGLTVARFALRNGTRGTEVTRTRTTDVALLGLELPTWRVRPFVELYLIELLQGDSPDFGGNILFGLNYKLP